MQSDNNVEIPAFSKLYFFLVHLLKGIKIRKNDYMLVWKYETMFVIFCTFVIVNSI